MTTLAEDDTVRDYATARGFILFAEFGQAVASPVEVYKTQGNDDTIVTVSYDADRAHVLSVNWLRHHAEAFAFDRAPTHTLDDVLAVFDR
jgi:hypothetical protein